MNSLNRTLLLVEDDPSLITLLRQNLEFEGYKVIEATDGKSGLDKARAFRPDLILLDLMLPHMSGIELCKQLRALGDGVPIIMLTARAENADKVRGLKTGADDYIVKPFDLLELLARIEAVLRRAGKLTQYLSQYRLADMCFDFNQHTIEKNGEKHSMTQQESLLLRYLVHHPGEVLTRDQILMEVWGHDYLFSSRTIDTHINRLRQKIEPIPAAPRYLLTVHRVGYKFVND